MFGQLLKTVPLALAVVLAASAVSPTSGQAPASKARTKSRPPVDLNKATAEQLQTLPGIGPAHAREIIAGRPYKSVNDLEKLKGLGKARVDAIRSLVVVAPRPSIEIKNARHAPGALVNLNTASRAELEVLPDIGPVKAQAIIDARPFKTKEDVMKVKGIKEGVFSKIKDQITVR